MSSPRTVGRLVRPAVFGLAALFVAMLIGLVLWGWQTDARPYVVVSGSMTPTIGVGDAVVVEPRRSPETGDVITFDTQGQTVTHRIINRTVGGYRTQGDANETPDPTPVRPESVLGRVATTIPFGGYALIYLGEWTGIASVLLLPITLHLGWGLAGTLAGTPAGPSTSAAHPTGGGRRRTRRQRSQYRHGRVLGLQRYVTRRRDRTIDARFEFETAAHRTGRVWS